MQESAATGREFATAVMTAATIQILASTSAGARSRRKRTWRI